MDTNNTEKLKNDLFGQLIGAMKKYDSIELKFRTVTISDHSVTDDAEPLGLEIVAMSDQSNWLYATREVYRPRDYDYETLGELLGAVLKQMERWYEKSFKEVYRGHPMDKVELTVLNQ